MILIHGVSQRICKNILELIIQFSWGAEYKINMQESVVWPINAASSIPSWQKGAYTQTLRGEGNMKTEHKYVAMILGMPKALEAGKCKEEFVP